MPDYISRLDELITIQVPVSSEGTYGECVLTFGSDQQVWASCKSIAGSPGHEEEENAKQIAYQRQMFEVRYDSALITSQHFSTKARVVFDSKNYDVYALEEKGRNDRIIIYGKTKIN